MREVCSKLTIKKPERRCFSVVFIVNFKQISYIVLVFSLLILKRKIPVGGFVSRMIGDQKVTEDFPIYNGASRLFIANFAQDYFD